MAAFTTMEIAAMCNKSERQVQRWIKKGTLEAQHVKGNRYEVTEEALAPFLPRETVENYLERIEALEHNIEALENRLVDLESRFTEMVNRPQPKVLRPARAEYTIAAAKPGEGLPDGLVAAVPFAHLHGIAASTVNKAMDSGRLPYITGSWVIGHATVKRTLDPAGQARFYQMYKDNPKFERCESCPHVILVQQ